MRYRVIYADPPWPTNTGGAKPGRLYDSVDSGNKYPIMSMDDLYALPIRKILANVSFLFLWVQSSLLESSFNVMRAWRFEPKTIAFIWVKTTTKGNLRNGLGPYTLPGGELCLLGTHGTDLKKHFNVSREKQIVMAPVLKHSQKPDEVRRRIESLVPKGPRLELFARKKYDNWDAYGNEIKESIKL